MSLHSRTSRVTDAVMGRRPAMFRGLPAFVGTIAAVLVSIIAFMFFDLSLAAIDRRESATHAASSYERGLILLRSRDADAAVDQFRIAVGLDRTNVDYSLALSAAMLEAGHASNAESTLKVLLTRTENEGAVNLTMAHVMVREGRVPEAKAYFHRAIFGRWGADSSARRTQARFELIQLLSEHGAPGELLAELLPFEDVSPDSIALRRRLGRLFLLAQSPARAANMFRSVLRRDPSDGEAYAGMGDAALAQGNFRTAKADFGEAAARQPDDPRMPDRLALVDTILALDPGVNDLTPDERFERSRRLLARTLDAAARCGDPPSGAASARELVDRVPSPPTRRATGEAMVAAAVELWNARSPRCDAAISDEALRAVLARLGA
jgi:tetratricopeptide (TPR) repeat protein